MVAICGDVSPPPNFMLTNFLSWKRRDTILNHHIPVKNMARVVKWNFIRTVWIILKRAVGAMLYIFPYLLDLRTLWIMSCNIDQHHVLALRQALKFVKTLKNVRNVWEISRIFWDATQRRRAEWGRGERKNKSEGIISLKDARDCAVLFVDRQTKRPEKCEGFTLDVAHRC